MRVRNEQDEGQARKKDEEEHEGGEETGKDSETGREGGGSCVR